jgi:putative hydroxymethylpyrimidine transport system substrate-binding protein
MTLRRPALFLTAVIATLGLVACGEKSEDVAATSPPRAQLSVLLDFFPNANHSGFFAAQGNGAFEQAGLDVKLQTPDDPATVLKLVAAGKVDLGISYTPEILEAREQGQDITAIASIVTRPLTSLVSLETADIKDPADLKGKTVGTAGIAYQTAYLDTIAKDAGLQPDDVKQVGVGFNLQSALLSRKVDATLGAFWNYEGTELELKGRKARVVPVDELGIPTYDELVLVARADVLAKKESSIRRLVRAVGQGYEAVRENPEEGIKPLLAANKELDPELQLEVTKRTLDVFWPSDKSKPWGWLSHDTWTNYAEWMLENGLLTKRLPLDVAVTNDFLPGEGAGSGRKTPGESDRPSQNLPGYRGS